MGTNRLAVCLVGFLACVSAPSQAQQISWQGDYDTAMKKAVAEKKPVMIVFLMDEEVANDEVARSHLHDPAVVTLSRSFVCLIGCTGAHSSAPAGRDSNPASRPACPKFGCVTCLEHQKVEMRARTEFMNAPRVAAPQFLFLMPDGKTMLLRQVYALPAAELAKKMQVALALHDPSKGAELLARIRATTDDQLKLANDNNMDKRVPAIRALATSDDPRVVDFLIKQTGDMVEEAKRLEAIEAMGQRGNGKVLPVLHKLLGARSNQVRIAVAKSLDSRGMPESGPPILAAARKEDKNTVRGHLVKALITCDPVTADHRKFVVGMIKSSAQMDKMNGLKAAGRLTLDEDLKKAILGAAGDTNPAVRGVAYWALGTKRVPEAASLIGKALGSEKNPDVKCLGTWAVSQVTGTPFDGSDPEKCLSHLFEVAGIE